MVFILFWLSSEWICINNINDHYFNINKKKNYNLIWIVLFKRRIKSYFRFNKCYFKYIFCCSYNGMFLVLYWRFNNKKVWLFMVARIWYIWLINLDEICIFTLLGYNDYGNCWIWRYYSIKSLWNSFINNYDVCE